MHVCVLTAGRYPPNGRDRVRRHVDALYERGHAVTVCARGAEGEPDHELRDGIDVERLPDESLYTGARGVLDGVRYALRFVHPAWVRAVNGVDDEQAVDVCCVCDLSLLKTGLKLVTELDVPVVCDLPGATAAIDGDEARGGRLRRVARRVFHSSWRRGRLVTNALPDADRLVTTCEEARAEYVREKGIDPWRVAVVRDTVAPVEIDHRDPTEFGLGFDPEDSFVVTAVADGCERNDLETLVAAAARVADRVVSLRLVVVCDPGRETLDDLETLARRRLAGGRITFRTETDRRADYVAASDVCVVPPAVQGPETSVPEGVFEAMAAGVPVVAADTPPVRRILTEVNAGRVVPDGPAALADALVAVSDPDIRVELGANGRRAAANEFDPDRDAARLRLCYDSVVAESVASGPASRFVSAIRYDPIS